MVFGGLALGAKTPICESLWGRLQMMEREFRDCVKIRGSWNSLSEDLSHLLLAVDE